MLHARGKEIIKKKKEDGVYLVCLISKIVKARNVM